MREDARNIDVCQYGSDEDDDQEADVVTDMAPLPVWEQVPACCPAPGEPPLGVDDAERLAGLLKALADPARLRLVSLLGSHGELCVCDLTEPLQLKQPTVSHHLKVLHEAGVLDRERRGTWVYYRLVPDALAAISGALQPAATG